MYEETEARGGVNLPWVKQLVNNRAWIESKAQPLASSQTAHNLIGNTRDGFHFYNLHLEMSLLMCVFLVFLGKGVTSGYERNPPIS